MNDAGTIEVNEERERGLHLQMAFKPGLMTDLAVAIGRRALASGEGGVWPDEVDYPLMKSDSACKGSTYHRLATVGVLVKDWGMHRTSRAESANARAVFFWRLADRKLAWAFLRANTELEMMRKAEEDREEIGS